MKKNIQIKRADHVQLGGIAYFDQGTCFMFRPDNEVPGRMDTFRRRGVAQQLSDGSIDFIYQSKKKPQSTLIHKLPHGRLSRSKDNAIILTLKVFCNEDLNIGRAMESETIEAVEALKEYQLKHY